MSSINNVAAQAYSLSFWQNSQSAGNAATTGKSWTSENTVSSSASQTASYSSVSSTIETFSTAINSIMNQLGLSASDKISFSSLTRAREQMEDEFAEKLRTELAELGIDEDVEFRLVSDGSGGIKVICADDSAKAVIEKYFEDNEKMVDKFLEIQVLSNLEDARKSQQYSLSDIRSRIQIETMTTWYASTGQTSSQLMASSGGGSWFASVGLDITA